VLGAGVGIGLGVLAGVLIEQFSPALTTTKPTVPGQATSSLSQFLGSAVERASTSTEHVNLSVPLHASTLLVAVALALVGGLLAGAIGGWRAARLAPAIALRDLG
jgi:putative ABC transport system permease protein